MNNNTEIAKKILTENSYTCVLYLDGEEYHSTLRGVKPLINLLESENNFAGFSAADKTVGAGAAHLYALLGVAEVWANVISEDGKRILEKNNISVYCGEIVPYIINRRGDGICPIEKAVNGIVCSRKALEVIKQTLKNSEKSD